MAARVGKHVPSLYGQFVCPKYDECSWSQPMSAHRKAEPASKSPRQRTKVAKLENERFTSVVCRTRVRRYARCGLQVSAARKGMKARFI